MGGAEDHEEGLGGEEGLVRVVELSEREVEQGREVEAPQGLGVGAEGGAVEDVLIEVLTQVKDG